MTVPVLPQFTNQYEGEKMRRLVDELVRQFQAIQQQSPESGGGGGPPGVTVHNDLTGRDATDSHPISAIGGLQGQLDALIAADSALQLLVNTNLANIIVNTADLARARTQRYFLGE